MNLSQHINLTFGDQINTIQVHIPNRELYTKLNVRYLVFVHFSLHYPLISFIAQKNHNRQTAITIKAYDEKYNPVEVKDLSETNRLGITFKPHFNMSYCYSYGDTKQIEHKGIVSYQNEMKNNRLRCVSSHFNHFFIGDKNIGGYVYPHNMKYWLIGLIVILSIICIGGIVLFLFEVKNRPISQEESALNGSLLVS